MSLTPTESRIASDIGFDQPLCEFVKQHTGGKLERLVGYGAGLEQVAVNGLSVAVKREEVHEIRRKIQADVLSRGYHVFWSDFYDSRTADGWQEIAVLRIADEYDFIRLRRTNGANYDVSHDGLIARLDSWRSRCQFAVTGAAGDWVAIEFATLPANICEFAEEVYEFCPDSVEQGVGLMNESKEPEMFAAARQLCPSLSPKMERKLADEEASRSARIPAELFALVSRSGFTTSTQMGIRLLAYCIHDSKSLFMWWD